MKKCPKCGANIQDNARFCLYCMTSFEEKKPVENEKEKNKRWIYFITAVLVVALLFSAIFIFAPKNNKSNNSNNYSIPLPSDTTSSKNNDTSSNEDNNDNKVNDTTPPNDNAGGQNNTNDTPNNGNNAENDDITNNTQNNCQPKYTYVEATFENTYPTGYSSAYAPENAIVITKVDYIEPSGNYVIPETIDGKKVAAIMPLAFSDASVKSVTLPSTVRTIWSNAFKNCYNLTDVYIKSTVIAIYEDAFPETTIRNNKLTLHCKRDCRNFDFYYYRNIADRYSADYIEWNG